jgi:hypothetical protein
MKIDWLIKDDFWKRVKVQGLIFDKRLDFDCKLPDLREKIIFPPTYTPIEDEDFPGPVERWYGMIDEECFILTYYYYQDFAVVDCRSVYILDYIKKSFIS